MKILLTIFLCALTHIVNKYTNIFTMLSFCRRLTIIIAVVIIINIIIVYLTIYWREPISGSFIQFLSFHFIPSFIYFILYSFAFSIGFYFVLLFSDKDYKHFLHSNMHSRWVCVCVCVWGNMNVYYFQKFIIIIKRAGDFSLSYLYSLSVFVLLFLFYTWYLLEVHFVVFCCKFFDLKLFHSEKLRLLKNKCFKSN